MNSIRRGGDDTPAKAVTAIAVKTQPIKLSYIEGQTLNLSGLVVTLTYNDSSTENVAYSASNFTTKGITASPANGTTLSVTTHHGKPVKVTCNSKTANTNNLTVVARALESIAVKTQPTKLSYFAGDILDLTGLVVTLTYNDTSTEDVTYSAANFTAKGITASPANGTALTVAAHNCNPVTLTCNSKTADTDDLTVTAIEVTDIAVKTQPTKLSYFEGQALDLTDLVVTLTYNDTSTEDVTYSAADFSLKGITAAPEDGATLALSHNGNPVVLTCNSKTADTDNLTVVARALTIAVENQTRHRITITSNYGKVVTGTQAATMTSGDTSTTWQNLGNNLQARVTTSFPNNMNSLVLTPNTTYDRVTISGSKRSNRTVQSKTLTVEICDRTFTDVTKSFTVVVSGQSWTTTLSIGTITP